MRLELVNDTSSVPVQEGSTALKLSQLHKLIVDPAYMRNREKLRRFLKIHIDIFPHSFFV